MSPITKLAQTFHNNLLVYCTKIFIVMSGVIVIPMMMTGELQLLLILGAVAAGLSDLDDHIKGRIKNIGLILLVFFIASLIVQAVIPYPSLFLMLAVLGTLFLIMLGALGERFATVSFGTLALMVYTMLTYESDRVWYIQPSLLVVGALWYNLVSLFFNYILPSRPVTESLAECYKELVRVLELKSRFFDPDEGESIRDLKLKLSISSKALSVRLDRVREVILRRLQNEQDKNPFPEMLNYYLTAQAIFERAASVHVEYEILHQKFLYSDLLFRFQRLMMQQGQAALKISDAISNKKKYDHSQYLERLTTRLSETILRLKKVGNNDHELFDSIDNLLNNLEQINILFLKMQSGITEEELLKTEVQQFLPDNTMRKNWKGIVEELYKRVAVHLTKESEVFRHAVRMSFVMGAGYLLILIVHYINLYILNNAGVTPRIFWIMMTAMFVCQPNSSATQLRITKRLSGTFVGVVLTILFIQLSPSIPLQALVVILSGTFFFAMSAVRYSFATAFITIMVLIGFNLNDYPFIAHERLIDTLIGCGLAWFAARYILPDWRYYNIPKAYQKVALENKAYLLEIRQQYHSGRVDDLAYMNTRAKANEADSELSSLFSSLSISKMYDDDVLENIFNNLCLNNTLLGYLSALGAHREKINNINVLKQLDKTTDFIMHCLELKQFDQPVYSDLKQEIIWLQREEETKKDPAATVLLQQLLLLLRTLPSYLKSLFQV